MNIVYKKQSIAIAILALLALLASCGNRNASSAQREESRQAKALLQGVWMDQTTEAVVFKMEGDSVYYPDSTSQTAYFCVVDDSLFIGDASRYHIEKQSEHVLWFQGQDGELVKLEKTSTEEHAEVFENPQILTLTEVMKKDTVVMYDNQRYHLYIAINPTRYKVVRHTLTDEGLDVENVYYDNIIHLSVFQGNRQVFSRDFSKKMYKQVVAERFLGQSILNNMEFDKVDADGFHLNSSLCMPGDASCYLIEHVVSFDGQLSTKLLEY